MDQRQRMESFLKDVERRAFRIARYSTGDPDEALDLVQDAMLKLVRSYADKTAAEWPPLFYRILDNGITDWYRRRAVRGSVMSLYQGADDSQRLDPVEAAADPAEPGPENRAGADEALGMLDDALGRLPERQRQAFLLRMLEDLSTEQTATAMGCSTGSVKTHYFRALKALRKELGEAW
ncbi:MAG: RNA polymerase sigma factor [Gammaproteobacteria bacterium]|nr:RNA polymerase sigma factor [Gammaproteobacteria bacterium]